MDASTFNADAPAGHGTAVVFGAGGVAGIAWMFGLVAGLAERGVDLTRARVLHGTSAGSVVAAELAAGVDPVERMARELAGPGSERLPAPEISCEERAEIVAARLSSADWPTAGPGPRLQLVVATADPVRGWLLGADSGVSLPLAVAASCAVPRLWPPQPLRLTASPGSPLLIDDTARDFLDGGIRSLANTDLADFRPLSCHANAREHRPADLSEALVGDADPVVHKILIPPARPKRAETADPRIVQVLSPDRDSARVIRMRPLDPALRAPAAEAGKAQAAGLEDEEVLRLAEVLDGSE